MNYILDRSEQKIGENMDIFSAPDVNTSIESVYVKQYNSTGKISTGSIIEFDVPNNSADYISLNDTKLDLQLKITKADGTDLTDTDNVALVNLIGASIFKQVDISLQQQNLTASIGSNYPYKAILDVLLSTNKDQQLTELKIGGFIKDFSKFMDEHEPKTSTNGGLKERFELTKKSQTLRISTKIYADIIKQERLLLNNVPINFKFYPANDKFCLMYKTVAGTNYIVNITDAVLSMTYVKVSKNYFMEQSDEIRKNSAIYPFCRSDIKTYSIASGVGDWSMDNLFQDNIPDILYLTMVESTAYNGDNTKNPFNFKHMFLTDVEFQLVEVTRAVLPVRITTTD